MILAMFYCKTGLDQVPVSLRCSLRFKKSESLLQAAGSGCGMMQPEVQDT